MLKEFYIDGKTFKNTTKLNFFINTVQFFFTSRVAGNLALLKISAVALVIY